MQTTLTDDEIASADAKEPICGLTTAEAEARAAQGHSNRITKPADGGMAAIIRRNVFTLFNLLNCVLAMLLIWVGSYRNLLFMGVVVSNALIGLLQELRAKHMHDHLLLLSQGRVQTLRDRKTVKLLPDELVLGDVICLRRGDQIPADAVVLRGSADVNESLLTGESEPLPKAEGAILLSGSYVNEGEVLAQLTAVGENSFAGQLQQSARKVKRPRSELMTSLEKLIRIISILLAPICIALYAKQTLLLGMDRQTAVTKTVGAAIGMIPEGLMLLTSVALAVGVIRLGRRKALVNELYGIENLARVDVLCLDKTGTLTNGRMKLHRMIPLGDTTEPQTQAAMRAFTAAFYGDEGPTQLALQAAYPPAKILPNTQLVPFSSERKWSAMQQDSVGSLVLGAPEKTLHSDHPVREQAREYAAQGLRVLVLSQSPSPLQGKVLPQGLVPVALLLLCDTLREDAAETLAYFREQNVTVKILSGDSPLTVAHIAVQAGLDGANDAVDCSALAQPVDYDTLARDYTVFGRVSPQDKRELIGAYKRQGHSVGMVGDGVNDVPALKAADCSIAMAGGSDAAARVAQITLLNSDFAVMPDILLEGRRVINNITRASALFLVKNLFSFLLATLLLVLPFSYPFAPIQLTLVSTLTIGFPSFILALQPNRERVRGAFIRNVLARALPGGMAVFAVCIGVMLVGRRLALSEAVISTLCTMVAGFSGLCVLAVTSQPMNPLRLTLNVAMAMVLLTGVLLFPSIFYLAELAGSALWLLGGALLSVALCLLLMSLVMRRVEGSAVARAL